MIYTKAVDIGRMSDADIKNLQPGQWVYTDTNKPLWRGRFWGVKPSGTIVVAWQGNARKHKSYWSYQKALFDYARAR